MASLSTHSAPPLPTSAPTSHPPLPPRPSTPRAPRGCGRYFTSVADSYDNVGLGPLNPMTLQMSSGGAGGEAGAGGVCGKENWQTAPVGVHVAVITGSFPHKELFELNLQPAAG